MADENIVVEETVEAPAAPTGVLTREFVQKGGAEVVVIDPTDEGDPRTLSKNLEVAFGEYHSYRLHEDGSKTDAKMAGRFQVTYPRVIDGLDSPIVVHGVNAKGAIESAIKKSGRGTAEDYLIGCDFEADFFKQKIEAPKAADANVWTDAKFADTAERLQNLGTKINEEIEDVAAGQEATQDDSLKLAKDLLEVEAIIEAVSPKNKRPAMRSFLEGPAGSNLAGIKTLGKGANTVYEAMELGRLSEAEYAVLPSTAISGKSVLRHRLMSLAAITEKAGLRSVKVDMPTTISSGPAPTAAGAAEMLRMIAVEAYGIEAAMDTTAYTLEALCDAVDEAATTKAAEFLVEYGKRVNTYQKEEYAYALTTYGRVTASRGGASLFADAAGQIEQLAATEAAGDQEKIVGETSALFNKNGLMRSVLKSAVAQAQTIATEKTNREVVKMVEDEDGPLGTKAVVKGFGGLETLAAAAHIFKLVSTRSDAKAVDAAYRSLVAQSGFAEEEKIAAE